jgi:hypothetical protein
MKNQLRVMLCATALCAAPFSVQWSPAKSFSLSLDTAGAVIGRPLTPLSVAGVHRRAHRRAYYGAAVAPYHAPHACGYYPYPPCY